MAVREVALDGRQEVVAKITVFREGLARFEVDEVEIRVFGGRFGAGFQGNASVVFLGEVIIGDERSGGALETGDFQGVRHKTGEAEGRVFRGVFLRIGRFVSFVDDDEAEVVNRGEEGGAGADDDERGCLRS